MWSSGSGGAEEEAGMVGSRWLITVHHDHAQPQPATLPPPLPPSPPPSAAPLLAVYGASLLVTLAEEVARKGTRAEKDEGERESKV